MARRNSLPTSIRNSVSRQAQRVLTTGQRFDRFDQIRQRHFWSNYYFDPEANGASGYIPAGDYKLFTTPSGQAGQGFPFALTDRETNWKSANRVPDNQNFEILELGLSIQSAPNELIVDSLGMSALQQNAVMQNTLLAIQYLTNEISLGYLQDFSQSAGPTMGSQTKTDVGVSPRNFVTNGFAAPGLRRRLRIPILLQHGETFSFNLKVPRAFFIPLIGGLTETPPFVVRMDFWATESFVERS